MNMKRQRPAIERGTELLAALSLSGAAAFGIFHAAPFVEWALIGAMVGGGSAAALGALALLGRIDDVREHQDDPSFVPGEFVGDEAERTGEADDELLLDDPIAPLEPQARVIELFEPHQPEALPEPGELVARIADYLDSSRGTAQLPSEPVRHDASASLHAALADIRRSLR